MWFIIGFYKFTAHDYLHFSDVNVKYLVKDFSGIHLGELLFQEYQALFDTFANALLTYNNTTTTTIFNAAQAAHRL